MFAEAPDIDRAALVEALRTFWGISTDAVSYEPVGFGSHHYVAVASGGSKLFLTVNDLRRHGWISTGPEGNLDALELAFRTAHALLASGLEFVAAPIPRDDGRMQAQIGDRYALAVFEYLDGEPGRFDEKLNGEQRRVLLEALGRLHGSTDGALLEPPRRDSFAIPLRRQLLRSMDELDEPWTGGPYSEPARELLSGSEPAVRDRLAKYDELAAAVAARCSWVVTHGEPHPGNLMWKGDSLLLIDWDTVAVGPPERDLWMVELEDDLDVYAAAGGINEIDPEAIELYTLWWSLAEVALYVEGLRSEHENDANTRTALSGLREHLPR